MSAVAFAEDGDVERQTLGRSSLARSYASAVRQVDTNAAMRVAAFRATLRSFLRETELVARASGLTPQRICCC
jgi:hypothetical protein